MNPESLSNENRFVMIISSLGLFMVQMCRERTVLVEKTFQLSKNSLVRKIFVLPQTLISQVKS